MPEKNIVLTGFMGTGKSSVGKRLAALLMMDFYDTDELVEKRENMTIPMIFRSKGESYFRESESEVIAEVSMKVNSVIATGGGAVLRESNMKALKKNGIIICLKANPRIVLQRTSSSHGRPLLKKPGNDLNVIEQMMEEREICYAGADYTIDTSNNSDEDTAREILHILGQGEKCP